MPNIFDNIDLHLLPVLQSTLKTSTRADFCVGYFNLRGWDAVADIVDKWPGGEDASLRLMVGMQKMPADELKGVYALLKRDEMVDQKTALAFRRALAADFKRQLTIGLPTEKDKVTLATLAAQLRAGKAVVKLHCRHGLHAKLYLCHLVNAITPIVGYLGSSNFTFAGLQGQGELNVDVLDGDACDKLNRWFDERWFDKLTLDISAELADILEESWITPRKPYHIYLKIAYHLSREARAGQAEFDIPKSFRGRLFDFQTAAVKIAARHVNQRGGVVIGDVVGLGKTMTACAIASIFQNSPYYLETMVICPPNLESMWENEMARLNVSGKVVRLSETHKLADEKRFRLVIIDESHNLRSGEGSRYRALLEYLELNESKVVLLSATPYNKHYSDLYHQLRLFVAPDKALGIRPEQKLAEMGVAEFIARHQAAPDSLAAFNQSPFADDWRELMRLYLVRRTRSFIKDNYAGDDGDGRKYLIYPDGSRYYFPARTPKTVVFPLLEKGGDQYARLYSKKVVDAISELALPRYGLLQYVNADVALKPTLAEAEVFADLNRAGKRLKGFCRTNLFKRLESCGPAFLLSVRRHIVRNNLFLHALSNDLPLPVGRQDATMLDPAFTDADKDPTPAELSAASVSAAVYDGLWNKQRKYFSWLRAGFFQKALVVDLECDNAQLNAVLELAGEWDTASDTKLARLQELVQSTHGGHKVLVFSQFADTVEYLAKQLKARGIKQLAGVTGSDDDPTAFARRFSPVSNDIAVRPGEDIRVLLATDVLSEGQNLQDAHIIVNFDLPWAIIRLIQRTGRVDRIGQQAGEILCYSFLPAEGIEKIIDLRGRLKRRLGQNAEVLGSDERFFDDETAVQLRNLYHEKSGILDDDGEGEVDLASHAFQIWKNATDADPGLHKIIPNLPDVVNGAKAVGVAPATVGAIVYVRTPADTDVLAQMDAVGTIVTQSQWQVLKAAACDALTPAHDLAPNHNELVERGVVAALDTEKAAAGGLGKPSGARYKAWYILKRYVEAVKGGLFDLPALHKVADALFGAPLKQAAADQINQQLKISASDEHIAELLMSLHEEGRLVQSSDDAEAEAEPHLICSLGLV